MAVTVLQVLRWFPGGEAIFRAEQAFLSCSDAVGGHEDRISVLHDHLLQDIVSRLPAKDAARTAFLDAGADLPAGGADGFPHLRELIMFGNEMPGGHNLDHLLARSPVLDTFAVALSKMFECVHLHSQSFKCVLL
ncbi:hypothetical protein ACQ4PT_030604 [Festuca glaucescens]